MAKQTQIKADISELQRIVKDMGNNFQARIGILGGNASKHHAQAKTRTLKNGKKRREKSKVLTSELTMSEIGVIQEFGSVENKIPPRSFLRMPIEEKMKDLIRFLGTAPVKKQIASGNIKQAFKMLGTEAVGIVLDAFNTRGFGKWAPNAQRTIDQKGSDAPLIDIGELRKSITYDVKTK